MHTRIMGAAGTLVMLTVLIAITPARADTRYWTNSAGGTYNAAGNWDPTGAPVVGDILYFTNNATYQVDYSTAGSVGNEQYYTASSGVVTNNVTAVVTTSSSKILSIGDSSGSTATVVQIGSGSFNANNTFVGNNGVGSLTVNGSTLLALVLTIGNDSGSAGSSVLLTNGAVLTGNSVVMGSSVDSTGNVMIITGGGTMVTNAAGSGSFVGNLGAFNTLRIEDGARQAIGRNITVGSGASSSNNLLIVTDPGSVLEAAYSSSSFGFHLGVSGNNNTLIVSNGAAMRVGGGGHAYLGYSSNNQTVVTGAGSTFSNVLGNVYVGVNASSRNNRLLIDDGAQFYASNLLFNIASSSGNSVQILRGGVLDANIMNVSVAANSISNFGGVFQFSSATPTITASGGNIVLTNGLVSFRGIANAPVSPLAGITYQGIIGYQLNGASNAAVASYTFDTGLGASNYQKLQLVGANPTWQGTALTVGPGGALVVSNATGARVGAIVTNSGIISVVNSTMTWTSNVVISGKYTSDPSTNTFLADVTVNQSGALAGGVGDLFDFKKSLFISSTNQIGFQLANSAVMFSDGGMHTNAITGADLGGGVAAWESAFSYETNFAYGELRLGSAADQICFTCGNIPTVTSNGLYIGWLDLLGNASLVTNLHAASGITLYYDATDTRNAYLNGQSYGLTDCDLVSDGGFLMPVIPEPSALVLVGIATGLVLFRRTKCA